MKRRTVLRSQTYRFLALALSVVMSVAIASDADAAKRRAKAKPAVNDKYAAIVVDAKTGKVLHASNADAARYPASLTKMMTLYVLFEDLQAGRVKLDTKFSVSNRAEGQAPSKIGLRSGSTISAEDAIKALVTKSANDAAVVIAENVSGSVPAFAARMTRTARAIGMTKTTFRNPNGLPDPGQKTSARDMATLGRALQDRFPQYYPYFNTRSFTYGKSRFGNHNRLLGRVEGVDGIKTGYTRASGFNLVTNVKRDGRHIVAVVLGGKTGASRDAQMRKLIAEYLPNASKGGRTAPMLVASAAPVAEAPTELVAASVAPRPRPEAAEFEPAPELMAEAAIPPMPASRPESAPADPISARISAATEIAELAYAPEFGSGDDPIARLTELARARTGVAPAKQRRDRAETSDLVAAADGWYIQIGAVPSQDAAEALLDKARSSAGDLLASASPVTQAVDKNGTTLYRARFAGFDKDDARAACVKLKTKSISCLAVPN